MISDIVGAVLYGAIVFVVMYFLAGIYFTNQHSLEELKEIKKVLEEATK